MAEQDEISFLDNEADERNIENDLKAKEDAVQKELQKTNHKKLELARTVETYETLLRTVRREENCKEVEKYEQNSFTEMKDDSYSKRRYHDGQLGTNHGLAFPKESYDSHTENNTFEFRRNLAHRYEPFLEDEQHRNVQKMVEEKYLQLSLTC